MKNFEELLKEELDKLPFEKGADDGLYNDGQLAGFEMGARWAQVLFTQPTKYEIKICHFSEVEISEEDAIGKMQNEGWEIVGNIGVPDTRAWCGEKTITVPFKRVIA